MHEEKEKEDIGRAGGDDDIKVKKIQHKIDFDFYKILKSGT